MADALIGHSLANYSIERLLGRGGMASVYYGFDSQLHRPAAIKVIDERHSGDTSYSARFLREARAMASWRHPNIPQIYQAGVENGVYFYAMEYIQGMDLEELLHQSLINGKLLPFEDILRYGKAIADALDYAHLNGAIHRDVKPSNVLISENGRILLTDFGLVLEVAKGTMGEVFGSPLYIAPEQARNSADAVPQSDLYSLGVILYEMVVGRVPFEDQSSASLAIKHITLEPPLPRLLNPDLSPEVEAVLLKALRKKPQERYQTGKALMSALEEGIGGDFSGPRILHVVDPPSPTLPFLPIDRGDQPQPTILEPGAGSYQTPGANPPSPTPTDYNLEMDIPGVVEQPVIPPPQKKYILTAVIGISVLATFCILLFGTIWLFSRLNKPLFGSAGQPLPTLLAGQRSSTPKPTSTIVRETATLTPSPTMIAKEILLSLSVQNDDNFVLNNHGKVAVPLTQMRFESEEGRLTGSDWEIDTLQPGQCVFVLRKPGKSERPKEAQCEIVGKLVTRNPSNNFWEDVFDIYFQDDKIDSCDFEEDDDCEVKFSLP